MSYQTSHRKKDLGKQDPDFERKPLLCMSLQLSPREDAVGVCKEELLKAERESQSLETLFRTW